MSVNWSNELRRRAYVAMPAPIRRSLYAARHPTEHPLHTDSADGGFRGRAAARLIRSISGDLDARCSAVSPRDQGDSGELLALALDASHLAASVDMAPLLARLDDVTLRGLAVRWPGEYNKLLAAIVEIRRAERVVEIGTHRGMGAVALGLCPPTVRPQVTTYDVAPYADFPGHVMRDDDERIRQVCLDLSRPEVFDREREVLLAADIIFLDGPKDGTFEAGFLARLLPCRRPGRLALLIIDDIRLLPMVKLWGGLAIPKLDATSLGHWSGTGLALL